MKYTGSCHCQKVRIEIETDIKNAMSCNCSICSRRGHLMHFIPENQLKIISGNDALTDYQWGKKHIHFLFCSTCGTAPYGHGDTPQGPMVAVNIRCLENLDIEQVPIENFDGKHKL